MDNKLRALERGNEPEALARARVRARVDVAVPWLAKPTCEHDCGGCQDAPCWPWHCVDHWPCPDAACHQPTWANAPAADVLQVAAYLGDAVARRVVEPDWQPADGIALSWPVIDKLPLPVVGGIDAWVDGYKTLTAKLPAIRVKCLCNGEHAGEDTPCGGTGVFLTSAERYMAVRAAVRAARGKLDRMCEHDGECREEHEVRMVLEAAEAWLRCPCPERAEGLSGLPEGCSHLDTWWVAIGWMIRARPPEQLSRQLITALESAPL